MSSFADKDNIKTTKEDEADYQQEKSDSEKKETALDQQEQLKDNDEVFSERRRLTMEEKAKDLEIGLLWIRKELHEMRQQDRSLSKDIGRLKNKVQQISGLVEREEISKDKNTEKEQQ